MSIITKKKSIPRHQVIKVSQLLATSTQQYVIDQHSVPVLKNLSRFKLSFAIAEREQFISIVRLPSSQEITIHLPPNAIIITEHQWIIQGVAGEHAVIKGWKHDWEGFSSASPGGKHLPRTNWLRGPDEEPQTLLDSDMQQGMIWSRRGLIHLWWHGKMWLHCKDD